MISLVRREQTRELSATPLVRVVYPLGAPQLLSPISAAAPPQLGSSEFFPLRLEVPLLPSPAETPSPNPISSRYLAEFTASPARSTGALVLPATYNAALDAAALVHRKRWQDDTFRRIGGSARELSDWLSRLIPPRTLTTCSPSDVVAFIEGHWVHHHLGRIRPDKRPSPGYTSALISQLSTAFRVLGRDGDYDAAASGGNPCDCDLVRGYAKGYRRIAAQQGYASQGAVPMTLPKLDSLCLFLEGLAADESRPVFRSLILRDRSLFSLLWHSSTRGRDCGKLTLSDFREPSNGARAYTGWPLPQNLPGCPYPAGLTLRIEELVTKTTQEGRAGPVLITSEPASPSCAVRCLSDYMASCSQGGHPVTHHLFRPSSPDRRAFEERPFKTNAIADRLRTYLALLDNDSGESVHSFRRGSLQAAAAEGASLLRLLERGQMKSVSTLRLYLHPTRHEAMGEWRQVAARAGGNVAAAVQGTGPEGGL